VRTARRYDAPPSRHGRAVPPIISQRTMDPPEIIAVDSQTIACDGGGAALGHPRVYLNLGDEGQVDCPYCGRRFVRARAAATAGAAAPPGTTAE
jgi:uncharacterized Zn-finger protein